MANGKWQVASGKLNAKSDCGFVCPMSLGFVINMLSRRVSVPVPGAAHSYAPCATSAAAEAALAAVAAHSATANCTKLMTAIKFFSLAPFAGFCCRCVPACRTNVNQRVCKCKVNSVQRKGKTFIQLSAKRRRHMSMPRREGQGKARQQDGSSKPGNCRAASSTKSSAQRDKQSSFSSSIPPLHTPHSTPDLLCSPLA